MNEHDVIHTPNTSHHFFLFWQTQASYVRLSTKDSELDALGFVQGMLGHKYGESYERPSLILSVTGGARNFVLPQRLEKAIEKGLRQAAKRTNAWVITGGTNTGQG